MDAAGDERDRDALLVAITPSQDLLVVGGRFSVFLTVTNVAASSVTVTRIDALYPPEFEPVAARPPAAASAAALPVVLQPGDSFQHQVSLRHKTAPFFAPSSRSIAINIQFEADGQARHIAPTTTLNLRPPLHYLMAGGLVGALVAFFIVAYGSILAMVDPPLSAQATAIGAGAVISGEAAAEAATPSAARLLGSLVVSVVIGIVAVVAGQFTKRGVTVEDFWGGVLIAFTVVLASSELVGLAQRATIGPGELAPGMYGVLEADDAPATPTSPPK
jgi:hypothetical protein